LRDTIERRGWDYPLLVQGEASRTDCSTASVPTATRSWWVARASGKAWMYVAMPLSLVCHRQTAVRAADDPVLSARLDALTKQGLSPFAVHQLPQAVITLKQGAGRLIRAETDRGVLMICDTRLVDKPYGRRIWQSLPPFKRTRELEVVRAFFTDPETAVAEGNE